MKKRKGGLTKHHRCAKSLGGSNLPENISWVPKHKHRAFHLLFEEGSPHKVARILNETYIDPMYEIIVVRRKK